MWGTIRTEESIPSVFKSVTENKACPHCAARCCFWLIRKSREFDLGRQQCYYPEDILVNSDNEEEELPSLEGKTGRERRELIINHRKKTKFETQREASPERAKKHIVTEDELKRLRMFEMCLQENMSTDPLSSSVRDFLLKPRRDEEAALRDLVASQSDAKRQKLDDVDSAKRKEINEQLAAAGLTQPLALE